MSKQEKKDTINTIQTKHNTKTKDRPTRTHHTPKLSLFFPLIFDEIKRRNVTNGKLKCIGRVENE